MNATPIIGTEVAKLIEAGLKSKVGELKRKFNRPPGLGVILVGDNPASKYYVATKEKVAKRAGLESFETILPRESTFDDVAAVINEYNNDPKVDGILLQLPLPKHLDSDRLLDLIDPAKDADGLHPINQGLLVTGKAGPRPCTPMGAMKLIDVALGEVDISKSDIDLLALPPMDLKGLRAVVVGRSILVGKPVALMLLERNATVTIAHSKTSDLAAVCREADILIAAVGVPQLIGRDFIKPGSTVIDVGINRLENGKLVGDVMYDEVSKVAKYITPVPGGVGPMTVIMLINNTIANFERFNEQLT